MSDNIIKGEDNIRYSATQVAEMFDLPVSTVRHYMTAFSEILDLEYSNKMRKFTKPSLKKFEFILKLREDGLTIQQIQKYCEREDIFTEEGLIPNDKSLALDEMIDEKLDCYLDKVSEGNKIIEDKIEQQNKVLEEIKQMSCVTKEEIEKASYKEGFGRKLHKLLFGDRWNKGYMPFKKNIFIKINKIDLTNGKYML